MDEKLLSLETNLRQYIKGLDPKLFELQAIKDVVLSSLTDGHHNINYLIVLNNQADKKFVLRFNLHPFDPNEGTDAEYRHLQEINGLHAPKVIYYGKPDFLNASVIIMEFIAGEHKEFSGLNKEEIELLAHATSELHMITKKTFSKIPGAPADGEGIYYDYLQSMISATITARLEKAHIEIYQKDRDVINEAKQKLQQLMEKYKDAFSGNVFSLLHLDIVPSNVLWNNNYITFVDWQSLSFGDRADEVAYIFAINNMDDAFQQTFLEEYKKYIIDETIQSRIIVYTLKLKLFDLAWSI